MSAVPTPQHLVVVGAAAGIGRWMGEHVLAPLPWQTITLLDTSSAITTLDHRYRGPTRTERLPQPPERLGLTAPETAVCLAVPAATLPEVAASLLPALAPDATVFDLSAQRVATDEILRAVRPELAYFGVHALFGTTVDSADGMTFAVCPDPHHPDAHRWLADAVEAAGGTVNLLDAARHDRIMHYVQGAAHQALLTFADVIGRAPFSLEQDLWANRTPVFELLLALAGRTLAPGQEAATASIQLSRDHRQISAELADAHARLDVAVEKGTETAVTEHLAAIRAPYPSALFTKIQQAGVLATSAVQSARARIATQKRAGELVGIRTADGSDRLHVGTVEHVTATSVVLRNILVGPRGRGVLLRDGDSDALANAKRLGIGGRPRSVEFALGRARILSATELESELDAWLSRIATGTKFLIPESISGASAVRVIESVPHVAAVELLSEEVRLGQRECVARFHIRADRSLAEVERAIQQRIDEVFVWPDGVVLPVALGAGSRVGYLGPARTFSETAAQQLARLVRQPDAVRVEYPDFPAVVGAVLAGEVVLGVLPITNSSSGLVDLAAQVLFEAPAELRAGGVVDVPVRFDAYVATGVEFEHGAKVYSHPQGLRQCSQFIAAHQLVEVPCSSNVEGCRIAAERRDGVALGPIGMDVEFDLVVARASVGNLAGALTRFLVIGREGVFSPPLRQDHTTRSVWVTAPAAAGPAFSDRDARYDEILRGPSGYSLIVSTSADRVGAGEHVRPVGTIPWSPRTPLVTV